jgi:hypothetical protein
MCGEAKVFISQCNRKDKFLEFALQVYMESKGTISSGVPILEPKQWIAGLYNTGIMNLL